MKRPAYKFSTQKYRFYGHPLRIQVDNKSRQILQKFALMSTALVLATSGLGVMFIKQAFAYSAPTILGELPYQQMLTYPLSNRASLVVNAADGNLIFQAEDLYVNGTVLPLSITNYVNSEASTGGINGHNSLLSIGPDVHVAANADGSATYQGPSGFKVTFPSNGAGGYSTTPNYTGATLSPASGGGWTLNFNGTGEVYTFNSLGNQTKDQAVNGSAITYAYDASNKWTSIVDTQGRTYTVTQPSSTEIQITDPTNRLLEYEYNTKNQLISEQDSSQTDYSYSYDTSGNLKTIQLPNFVKASMTYNSAKQVTSITYNSTSQKSTTPATWNYAYNSGSTVVTDPLNHATTYSYDTQGRVTSVLDADGNTYSQAWDANNNKTSSTDPASNVTSYAYDSLNNLTSITDPSLPNGTAGAQTGFSYGSSSHPYAPSTASDAQGNQASFSYDTIGNLTGTTNTSSGGGAMGGQAALLEGSSDGQGGTEHCGAQTGEVCKTIDANGNVTTYGYDTAGNQINVKPPNSVGGYTIGYDSLSRPTSYTDGNGKTETITYNSNDLPATITTPDSQTISLTYDGAGNMLNSSDTATGVTTVMTYDADNRILTRGETGAAAKPYQIKYTYDLAGNLTNESSVLWNSKTTSSGAGTTVFAYDSANNPTSISNSTTGFSESIAYTHNRPSTITLAGGITETIGYDQAGRETSIKATKGSQTLTDYSATYTTTGNKDSELVQQMTNNKTGVSTAYSYDGHNRLTSAIQSGGSSQDSFTYSYDTDGNVTGSTHNGVGGPALGYNADNELISVNGVGSGSYDESGNQTTNRNNLTSTVNAHDQTNSFTPSGSSVRNVTYGTPSQQYRTTMGTMSQANGILGLYSDTANGAIGSGTVGQSTWYTHAPSGEDQTIGETIGATPYYYLVDLQGSVVAVTDGSGNVQDTYSYDPYGNLLTSTGSVVNTIRYAGGYYDSSTGLYKFGERYYNPTDARWTQLDPTGQNPGYIYADDDPVNNSDPTGTLTISSLVKINENQLKAYRTHDFKYDVLGKKTRISKYNVYRDKNDDHLYLKTKNGDPIDTYNDFEGFKADYPIIDL